MVQAQGIQISWGNCSVRNCWWSVCLLVLRAAHDTRVYVWIGHPPFDVGRARLREAKQLISQLKARREQEVGGSETSCKTCGNHGDELNKNLDFF